MKKLLIVSILMLFITTSCNKEYSCQMTTAFPNEAPIVHVKTIKAKSRAIATEECKKEDSISPYDYSQLL